MPRRFAAENRTEIGRLESEHLAFVRQRRLDLGKRCSGTRRHHQFVGLVHVDPAETSCLEHG
ncbi:MAG: hypothetical protein R3C97_19305 [Geminicoccaceae bacterium]